MPFTKLKCANCGKVAETTKTFDIGTNKVSLLKCGHFLTAQQMASSDPSQITSLDGKHPYPFQVDGIRFIEESGGRCLIADEMALGKTVQAVGAIKLHPLELTPTLFIVKSGLKYQFQHEIMRWAGMDYVAQIIEDSQTPMLPGLKAYIVSFDLLRRLSGDGATKEEKKVLSQTKAYRKFGTLKEQMTAVGVKCVVIDECQQIKNPASQRAQEVRALCVGIEHVIALSGTPIKNNASEYFSILNILYPEKYYNYNRFVMNECDSYHNGYTMKVGGLRDPEAFTEKTKNFIIRRMRKDVLPDLPSIARNFSFHELSKEVEARYKATFVEFQNAVNTSHGNILEDNILAYLSKMRHLVGLSLIEPCLDFVTDFLFSTDRKITIFVHHKDVGEILKMRLTDLMRDGGFEEPISFTADMSAEQRQKAVMDFRDTNCRVFIASTLAAGEGLNLQFCSDCILLERQWNPANEEQAEARFPRPGQLADKITATYFIAIGTVCEFFSEIVERKREIVSKTLGGEAVKWDQSSLMKELTDTLSAIGGKKWGI